HIRIDQDFELGNVTWLVLRVVELDLFPREVALFGREIDDLPELLVTLASANDTGRVVAIDSDVDLAELGIEIRIPTCKITITVPFGGQMSATVEVSAWLKVAGSEPIDVSGYVRSHFEDAVNDRLRSIAMGSLIEEFLRLLMRLDADARIELY